MENRIGGIFPLQLTQIGGNQFWGKLAQPFSTGGPSRTGGETQELSNTDFYYYEKGPLAAFGGFLSDAHGAQCELICELKSARMMLMPCTESKATFNGEELQLDLFRSSSFLG